MKKLADRIGLHGVGLTRENDAIRLTRSQVRVKQICTGTICHLDASMVSTTIDDRKLEDLGFLFIENIGNLVCPSNYDLGEQARMVLLSVTEREDKPLKYPTIFKQRRPCNHYEERSCGSGGVLLGRCASEHSERPPRNANITRIR
jgi:hydrogenase accessory protein HypB